jgi:hypothetical protein
MPDSQRPRQEESYVVCLTCGPGEKVDPDTSCCGAPADV